MPNSNVDKLLVRDDVFEVIVMALKEETMVRMKALNTRIKELEGKLVMCRVIMGK